MDGRLELGAPGWIEVRTILLSGIAEDGCVFNLAFVKGGVLEIVVNVELEEARYGKGDVNMRC